MLRPFCDKLYMYILECSKSLRPFSCLLRPFSCLLRPFSCLLRSFSCYKFTGVLIGLPVTLKNEIITRRYYTTNYCYIFPLFNCYKPAAKV